MSATDGRITIFLLDDHEIVRRGLRDLFEAEDDFVVVGESGSAVEAMSRIPALRPNVAVLDGRLPDGTGVDVCRSIRSVDPTIQALILTSYDFSRPVTFFGVIVMNISRDPGAHGVSLLRSCESAISSASSIADAFPTTSTLHPRRMPSSISSISKAT